MSYCSLIAAQVIAPLFFKTNETWKSKDRQAYCNGMCISTFVLNGTYTKLWLMILVRASDWGAEREHMCFDLLIRNETKIKTE